MADIAPTNRKRGRPKGSRNTPPYLHRSAMADSLAVRNQQKSLSQSQSQSAAPPLATGIGEVSGDADPVGIPLPPAELGAGMEMRSEPVLQPFTGYGGKYGLIKTNIVSTYAGIGVMLGGPTNADGVLFLSSAERIADAWVAWGRADPRYMRIVSLLWGSPMMTLVVAHAPLVGGIMTNHGISMGRLLVPMNMRSLGQLAAMRRAAATSGPSSRAQAEHEAGAPPPLPYQPVGPFAPTEAAPPPSAPDEGLRILPDEGLPADIEVQLREISRTQGIPYQELYDQAMLQLAQLRMQQNGKVASQAPALGVPVAKPE